MVWVVSGPQHWRMGGVASQSAWQSLGVGLVWILEERYKVGLTPWTNWVLRRRTVWVQDRRKEKRFIPRSVFRRRIGWSPGRGQLSDKTPYSVYQGGRRNGADPGEAQARDWNGGKLEDKAGSELLHCPACYNNRTHTLGKYTAF